MPSRTVSRVDQRPVCIDQRPVLDQRPVCIDQRPFGVDQRPVWVDQRPVLDQRPVCIDQRPVRIDSVEWLNQSVQGTSPKTSSLVDGKARGETSFTPLLSGYSKTVSIN